MSLNNKELLAKMSPVTTKCLQAKGYLCFIDVLIAMGYLSEKTYEDWRFKRIPYLERGVSLNLSKINFLLRSFHKNCVSGKLKPSITAYKSWGKCRKLDLKFSKSGDPKLEKSYATRFISQQKIRKEI